MNIKSGRGLNELMELHSPALRNFIHFLGVKADDIDDIAQETLIIAYQKRESLDSVDNFGKWIRGIARNLVLNHLRREKIRNDRFVVLFDDDMIAEVEEHYKLLDITTYIDRMKECMEALPERNRNLLIKRYENKKNSSELSEIYNSSPSAIRKLLMKTRILVADCIETKFKTIEL